MSTTSNPVAGRRHLVFRSINDIREDLYHVTDQPHRTLGDWSFGQILEHLTTMVNCSFDGFGFQAKWWLRTFVAPFIKRRFLTSPMPAGISLSPRGSRLLPRESIETSAALDRFYRALQRLERDIPRAEHPVFGFVKPEEWLQFHLRHAELHLSFVVPE